MGGKNSERYGAAIWCPDLLAFGGSFLAIAFNEMLLLHYVCVREPRKGGEVEDHKGLQAKIVAGKYINTKSSF